MRTLEWRYRGWTATRELTEQGRVLATIRWTWTRAEATLGGRTLRLRTKGFWKASLRLEDEAGGVVASMPYTGAKEHVAELPGRTYRWRRPSYWRMEALLETSDGRRVARVTPEGLRSRVDVEVEDPSVPDADLLPLLVLQMHAMDSWGASASTTVVTTTVT